LILEIDRVIHAMRTRSAMSTSSCEHRADSEELLDPHQNSNNGSKYHARKIRQPRGHRVHVSSFFSMAATGIDWPLVLDQG
jgi:hypothetical protein